MVGHGDGDEEEDEEQQERGEARGGGVWPAIKNKRGQRNDNNTPPFSLFLFVSNCLITSTASLVRIPNSKPKSII